MERDELFGNAAEHIVNTHLFEKQWTRELELPPMGPNRKKPMELAMALAIAGLEYEALTGYTCPPAPRVIGS